MVFEKIGPNEKIHNVELGEHNVRVSITKALYPNASLPVPVYGEMEIVEDAIGSLVAWPKEFVLSGLEVILFNASVNIFYGIVWKKIEYAKQENTTQIEDDNVQPVNNDDCGAQLIDTFRDMVETMADDPLLRIPLEKGMFGVNDIFCFLSKKVLLEVCSMGWLDVNAIIAYMR